MKRFEASRRVQKFWLAVEGSALFVGVPAAYAAGWLPVNLILLLVVMAAGCGLALRWRQKMRLRDLLRTGVPRKEWQRVLAIYALAVPCLLCLLWVTRPDAMLSLVCRHPKIWLLVMVAYPIVSVWPQELVYRVFFFERYGAFFGRGTGMVAASAAAFSLGHIVFHNWPAVGLTFAGGWLFANTYQRTHSLLLVAVEHALYGCAVFTIGYGEFFFNGTMQLFR